MRSKTLERLRAARARRCPAVLVTDLGDGRQWMALEGEPLEAELGASGELETGPGTDLDAAVARALREERSAPLESGGRRFFVHVFSPSRRLVIVGAVHIAQALVSMALQAGYAVTLVDPRSAWAREDRFPGVVIDRRWPQPALAAHGLDARSALVTLTHDPKLDDPALAYGLRSEAFYIGALGSRRTQDRRRERLQALGFDAAAQARIHGPVGLDIGAVSPAEVAISILAEITQEARRARS